MQKLKRPVSIILSILMVVSMFVAVPVTASAAAAVDVATEADFVAAVNDADANPINITGDFTLNQVVTFTANKTVDFKDKTVTVNTNRAIVVDTGTTVSFKGTTGGLVGSGNVGLALVKGTLNIYSGKYDALEMTDNGLSAFKVEPGAWLNMQGGEINAKYYGIYTHGENSRVWIQNTAKVHSVDASAISGNGLAANAGYYIYINGGTITSDNDSAIYHPNVGTLQISPYKSQITIQGATGIYTKAGTTKITANKVSPSLLKIIGTGAQAAYAYNGNGTNPTGDAFVIDNCNYPGSVPSVDIKFGTFESDNGNAIASYVGQDDPNYTGPDQEAVENFISVGYEGYEPVFSTPVDEEYFAEGFKPVDNGDGTYTVAPKVYVAQIGDDKYETLAAAFEAATDGDTITVLADCNGNGISVPEGKFGTDGLTVDFDGHTYTVDDTPLAGSPGTKSQAFQLLKDNKITFKDGTITSELARMLVQNYSNLTLDGMTLDGSKLVGTGRYTLSNNNGNVVIDDTTIIAKEGNNFAFDVCRYSSYPSVHVTVTGNSVINGDVEISASSSDAKEGFSLTLESGELNGNIVVDKTAAAAMAAAPEKAKVTKDNDFTQAAPAGYKWDANGVLVPVVYVAKIGDNKYETLEAAFAAAVDGDTITVLANCSGNGIKAPQGKFGTNGLTVDFGGFTYTVDGTPVGSTGTETNGFQLLKDNNITFRNGAITGDSTTNNSLILLIQNYSNLTLDKMTLSLTGQYYDQLTMSNNNGTIVINDSTINAPDYTWAGITDPSVVRSYAFDVCRYASYPSVSVTVTGNSTINGGIQVDAGNGDAKNGVALNLNGGTMTGDIVLTDGAKAAMAAAPEKAKVTKDNDFTQAAPADYEWVDNGDGTSSLAAIPYVAQIEGGAKYRTLEEAVAAAVDGDTVTLLANSSGNGIQVLPGRFTNEGLTIDFAGYTYDVDGATVGSPNTKTQAFQLQMNNKITLKDGTITSSKALMLVQNYSDLTLDNMILDGSKLVGTGRYTLSNNNGNVVIDDTTIIAKEGNNFAFDVCRFNSYPSVHVTVTGNSVINGDVEISASKSDAKDGFSLTLESGKLNGNIVVDKTAAAAMAATPDKAEVDKATGFTAAAPAGYEWVADATDGGQTLAKTKKLFVGHSVTLDSDIGVNFFLNPEVLNNYTGTKTVKFTVDGEETTVDVPETPETDGYKVTCNVVAARMAHKIKAEVFVNGTALKTTDSYSVQDYAEEVYYDNNKPEKLKALAKAMLNYGSEAQIVFTKALTEHPDRADSNLDEAADYSGVTADAIAKKIKGKASDLNEVATKLDAEFYTSSLIYLSKNTLRLYFTPASETVGALDGKGFSGSLSGYYYYVDHANIPAAELDDQQTFTVGGTTFTFSALDYAKAVVNSGMGDDQKNLAKALFLYNQAANAYFG